MPGGRVGGGIGGAGIIGIIVALVLFFISGGGGRAFDIGTDLQPIPAEETATGNIVEDGPDPVFEFVKFVETDIQAFWDQAFTAAGESYRPARLRVFRDAVRTSCGDATSAAGPFYCPADENVYLDLAFFRELEQRFGAPGDFAQAYVIAHEFGHHVQNLVGTMGQVQVAQRDDPGSANDLSVRLELQADCYAGVWGHSAYQENQLEEGDLEEGLQAAASVGDDRLQERAGVRVDRETFTHGSSQERQDWFLRGFNEGTTQACDTFR